MKTRRFMAAVVLAALPLFVGAVDATPAQHVIERPDGPRWLYSVGVDWDYALLIGQLVARCRICPEALAVAR